MKLFLLWKAFHNGKSCLLRLLLKELRLLANYEVDSANALTILLCGQQSLLQKFGLSALEPLANSITVSVTTDGLRKARSS